MGYSFKKAVELARKGAKRENREWVVIAGTEENSYLAMAKSYYSGGYPAKWQMKIHFSTND